MLASLGNGVALIVSATIFFMTAFSATGLHEDILSAVQELGFEQPTPIQAKTIPFLLDDSRKDVVALAQTGTGKTGAFGLPLVHTTDPNSKETQALVLCPTRELCLQIARDLKAFSKNRKGLKVLAVYGGSSISGQIKALKRGVQIVIGTPGRTKDLIQRNQLDLSTVNRIVLDEADEMLTMGFKEDLDAILSQLPKERQTLLFSATISSEIRGIAKAYMNKPEELSVAAENQGAKNVTHQFFRVRGRDRYQALKRLADLNPDIYGIVFCRTRRETKEIANQLLQDGYNADALHGELAQSQRDEVMGRFRRKSIQILVATDVAARGLDVNDLSHVINYNLPDNLESYIHRSGRTGRAGKSGVSAVFVSGKEERKLKQIERLANISFEKEDVPTADEVYRKQLFSFVDKVEHTEFPEDQIGEFMPEILKKLDWLTKEQLVQRFIAAEFNRFLETYEGAKDLNAPADKSRSRDKKSPRERRSSARFKRMYINVGQGKGLHAGRLIGLINNALDSNSAEIGKIEIMKKFAFFEIEERAAKPLAQKLSGDSFSGIPLLVEEVSSGPKGGGRSKKQRSNKPWKKSKQKHKA